MKVAMIGQKGLPATYGGVEHHVEQLGRRLVERGVDVTVFTRPHYSESGASEYLGMKLRSLPTLRTKHLDAIVHSLLSTFATWFGGYDVVHYHATGPALLSPLARLRGRRVVVTIHGQDWRRAKWGRVASSVLRLSEPIALTAPHVAIAVSEGLAAGYQSQGHKKVRYIPNGVSVDSSDDPSYLAEMGLSDGRYVIFVGRLSPEKGAHYLTQAWRELPSHAGIKLVIVGGTSHSDDYVKSLRESAPDVLFTGYLHGTHLATLFRHAGLFVLPSDIEGLPLVLLEAMAHGVPVLASDISPNVEVLGKEGRLFRAGDVEDLKCRLTECLESMSEMKRAAGAAQERVVSQYDWELVADQTHQAYLDLFAPGNR